MDQEPGTNKKVVCSISHCIKFLSVTTNFRVKNLGTARIFRNGTAILFRIYRDHIVVVAPVSVLDRYLGTTI